MLNGEKLESCGTPRGPRQCAGRGRFLDRDLLVFEVVVRRCCVFFLRLAFLPTVLCPGASSLFLPCSTGCAASTATASSSVSSSRPALPHFPKQHLVKKCLSNSAGSAKLGTRGISWFVCCPYRRRHGATSELSGSNFAPLWCIGFFSRDHGLVFGAEPKSTPTRKHGENLRHH